MRNSPILRWKFNNKEISSQDIKRKIYLEMGVENIFIPLSNLEIRMSQIKTSNIYILKWQRNPTKLTKREKNQKYNKQNL